MGQIQHRGVLRVGVVADSPPFASLKGGSAKGFEVDLARTMSAALGVKLKVKTGSPDALVTETDTGKLDMSFPNIPVTEAEIKPPKDPTKAGLPAGWPQAGVQFVDPFWVGHERLLVPSGSPVKQISALSGKKVCAVIDPATEPSPVAIDPKVRTIEGKDAPACVPLLRSGRVAAATSSDINLMAMLTKLNTDSKDAGYRLVGDQLSTEGYGILVASRGSAGWLSYLNSIYGGTDAQDRWTVLYRRWLAPYHPLPAPVSPPTMSVGEAASLFPNQP